jgi:hypothetical protein
MRALCATARLQSSVHASGHRPLVWYVSKVSVCARGAALALVGSDIHFLLALYAAAASIADIAFCCAGVGAAAKPPPPLLPPRA